ncbi:MAG TPA: DUF2249 domain-containing protein [Steroidobacteraceae bacterium]|nr:DUF2249 domain-containing protein [Steroidobacteraceae bacterium]
MTEPMTLDLREDLRKGGEPLPRILQAVGQLRPGQSLRLLATFEPLPLYAVLGRKGFGHRAVRHAEGDWEVIFSPQGSMPTQPAAAPTASDMAIALWPKPSASLDNRGLLPPEPMVRILDALERLGPGQVLEALNERDPVFLYPELQARGAAIHSEKVDEGVRLLIRRAG